MRDGGGVHLLAASSSTLEWPVAVASVASVTSATGWDAQVGSLVFSSKSCAEKEWFGPQGSGMYVVRWNTHSRYRSQRPLESAQKRKTKRGWLSFATYYISRLYRSIWNYLCLFTFKVLTCAEAKSPRVSPCGAQMNGSCDLSPESPVAISPHRPHRRDMSIARPRKFLLGPGMACDIWFDFISYYLLCVNCSDI